VTRKRAGVTLTLYTKPDCHLCEEAKKRLLQLQKELGFPIEEVDISKDPNLLARYGEEVPVGLLEGEKVFKYRVDERRLRRLVEKALSS
jgi:glutaredoxin